jgi:hypothetical protein
MTTPGDGNSLSDFSELLRQLVLDYCGSDADEPLAMNRSFTDLVRGMLAEQGEITVDSAAFDFSSRPQAASVSGMGIKEESGQLDIIVTIWKNRVPPVNLRASEIQKAVEEGKNFAGLSISGELKIDEGHDAYQWVKRLEKCCDRIDRINLFVFTDQLVASVEGYAGVSRIGDKELTVNICGLEQLHRIHIGSGDEPVDVDFVREFGESIPCIASMSSTDEYDSYMAVIPGAVLHAVYDKYRTRLLEDNVRNFLQSRGKVNRQIMDTLRNRPDRFFAYNNGISTIAAEVEFVRGNRDGQRIRALKNWRIVNGGQTTASIHSAGESGGVDLGPVFVPAKIIVVRQDTEDDLIPSIARYANSQNKVEEADFSSNEPYYRELQRLSRTLWMKSPGDVQLSTRWYFERTRGQYEDEKKVEKSQRGGQARFDRQNPRGQKFTKLDIAKSENAWIGKPNVVSLGKQKNFQDFNSRIEAHDSSQVDNEYFSRLIAKRILFIETEKIVKANLVNGYKANIVAYAVAYLGLMTEYSLDLDRIYVTQRLPDPLGSIIKDLVGRIDKLIVDGANDGRVRNIGEWCKKPECWEYIKLGIHDLPVPESLLKKSLSKSLPEIVITTDNGTRPGVQVDQNTMQDFLKRITRWEWQSLISMWETSPDFLAADRAFLISRQVSVRSGRLDARTVGRLCDLFKKCYRFGNGRLGEHPQLRDLFTKLEELLGLE